MAKAIPTAIDPSQPAQAGNISDISESSDLWGRTSDALDLDLLWHLIGSAIVNYQLKIASCKPLNTMSTTGKKNDAKKRITAIR